MTIRYLLPSRRQPSAVLWYPFQVLRPIPSYHSSTKCASKKYEKYPNISFSPCQTGQGRRFRINLAGCLEILLPMPVSEPASGAFFREMQICLPGLNRNRRNLNRYQFPDNLKYILFFVLLHKKGLRVLVKTWKVVFLDK